MPVTTKAYRYQLPTKALKADCPQCGPRHRRTLSRYVDTTTGEALPESYGRCDRESNCGYHLSPYHKGQSGISYADEVYQSWKEDNIPHSQSLYKNGTKKRCSSHAALPQPVSSPPSISHPVYSIPDEPFQQSLGHYERNQFARLLIRQFGQSKADELLQRFQIGTSSRWPGACVFWLKDQQQRVRAGQVVLFADDWHKAKYIDKEGTTRVCISSVNHSLLQRYQQKKQSAPDWLNDYNNNAPRWPILFGLHQLATMPVDQLIAIVEAPKTAVVCSALIPRFIWLAVGSLSYLNAERLAPLLGRAVMLFPDLSKDGKAFARWSKIAYALNAQGYQIRVSKLLEQRASDEQKEQGLDLADFLLTSPATVSTLAEQLARPGSILKPDESAIERLTVEPCDDYPAEWDIDQPTALPLTSTQWNPAFPMPGRSDIDAQLARIRWNVLPDIPDTPQ